VTDRAQGGIKAMLRRVAVRRRTALREDARRLTAALSHAAVRVEAAWEGVTVGPGCRFYGVTRFHRVGRSRIAIGEGCVFRSVAWSNPVGVDRPCMVSAIGSGARVEIGSGSGFSGTVICAAEEIVIGDNVLCGSNVTIVDADWHGLDPAARRGNVGATAPVRIEDDVFIGLGAVVLKGVTIGHGSVIGAGSVVTRSIPERSVAAGNPARVIRALP
jgi:acetyltransferase-like isoleucine patch superfamily enzyme